MKKLWIIVSFLVVWAACSDNGNPLEEANPFSPLTDLSIPVRAGVETEITLRGKGFTSDCEIWLQLNGGDKMQAHIVKVDDSGLTFTATEANSGFYAVILVQGGKEYRIGGINLIANDLEPEQVEVYAVRGELAPVVYPVSVTGKWSENLCLRCVRVIISGPLCRQTMGRSIIPDSTVGMMRLPSRVKWCITWIIMTLKRGTKLRSLMGR